MLNIVSVYATAEIGLGIIPAPYACVLCIVDAYSAKEVVLAKRM
ncbi:hypothetical protein [Brachyspira innocens]|uniref:Uncharacterized protein n=1 Tax=Brachyspira innocens TaxID=13264 RepID=A0ABT8Z097_9SPIR|nr:hypothetical protein [Brachyspira innocens]MDO7021027.1 hypothetical protein [Brachyspira innocens]